MTLYRLADAIVDIRTIYDYFPRLAAAYTVSPDMALEVAAPSDVLDIVTTQAEIDDLRASDNEYRAQLRLEGVEVLDAVGFSDGYCEFLVVLHQLAERAPHTNRMLMHGAVIEYEGRGYMFSAPPGTGKSTHIHLWRKYLGPKVIPINGDKPFLRFEDDGIYAYGTPWAGKEGWQTPRGTKLAGLCFVHQSHECAIRGIGAGAALGQLSQQVYFPQEKQAFSKTFDLVDRLLREIPVFDFDCDISEDAVKTSFEALTGLSYETNRTDASEAAGQHQSDADA